MSERYRAFKRNGEECKFSFRLDNPLLVQIGELKPGVVIRNHLERFYPGKRWTWDGVADWCKERNLKFKHVYTEIFPERLLVEHPNARQTHFGHTWYIVQFETASDAILFKLSWI